MFPYCLFLLSLDFYLWNLKYFSYKYFFLFVFVFFMFVCFVLVSFVGVWLELFRLSSLLVQCLIFSVH
jgi:hypothetical protein